MYSMEIVHFRHTSHAAILSSMKTPSTPKKALSLLGPGILLVVLFVAGSLAGRGVAVPLSAPALGVALVLLALRLGVMAAAIEEPTVPRPRSVRPGAGKPVLHAARG
jgi:hypothetical protein